MKRIRPLVVLLSILALLLLTACSKPAATPPAQAAAEAGAVAATLPEPVTIRVLAMPWDPFLDAVIEAFYQVNAQIQIEKVELTMNGPEIPPLNMLIQPRLDRGEVDLYPPSYQDQRQLAANSLPLDSYLAASGLDLQPFGPMLDFGRSDGKLYTMPVFLYLQAMRYNGDRFAEAHLPEPAAGWTWDDYRQAAVTLTAGDETYKQWGGYEPYNGALILAHQMVDERFGTGPLTPEGAREVMDYWADLVVQKKAVTPMPPRDASGRTGLIADEFGLGRGAMSTTFANGLRDDPLTHTNGFKAGLAPLPVVPGKPPGQYASSDGYAIAANSPHPDAAWAFLKFLSGPEGAQVLARHGWFPAYRSEAARQAWFEQSPAPPRSTEMFFTLPIVPMSSQVDAAEQKVRVAFWAAMDGVLEGRVSADAAYQQFMAARAKL